MLLTSSLQAVKKAISMVSQPFQPWDCQPCNLDTLLSIPVSTDSVAPFSRFY
jgi:hypothetical protein